ncbi:ALDH-like protein [Metschnikowia bicuspidata var. bicuspidata NRRL YB-4993]|uniref:ALDH-like protein n=1 Tax=Metschnikowia bicuspidata var. bicuspidata NRRL YB-4993 TaxID=869754 RepID=A0A1A0HAJ1_9ASCO|nr:ALDH-like protein [Metschnikowia bicuspidata var. bicuspidata NRRL YB-4993]OBA21020.1 ALDH-like protein [Metschnikowia bicuspidata var. bicuspidata NRRL YB-4993]
MSSAPRFGRISKRHVSCVPCVLSGKPVRTGLSIPVFSHTGEIVHHYSALENAPGHVSRICEEAQVGFLKWAARPADERRQILFAAAAIIEKHADLYVEAHREIGGPAGFARLGVAGAVAGCREYALQITNPDGVVLQLAAAQLAYTRQTPMGPVLAVAAWNAPAILWARAVLAPLAAGCSVVLKSLEKAPLPPYLLVQHLLQAGVDAQALQLVQVRAQDNAAVVESLLQNRRIKKVNFTGSTAVGRQVAAVAAHNLKPALLELGGKNVSVVCRDADLPKAAADALSSAWLHKGQVCMCLDTVYVDEHVCDEFVRVLQAEAARLCAENTDLRLNQRDAGAARGVHALVADAVAKGARVLHGGLPGHGPSNCSPVILTGVAGDMRLAAEESFGPVLSVEKFASVPAVVEHINDQPHGLKASVWSSDVMAAVAVASQLDFGGVHINGSTVHDEPTVPHGAVKESGSGRFNSVWGIEEFRYTKAITVAG